MGLRSEILTCLFFPCNNLKQIFNTFFQSEKVFGHQKKIGKYLMVGFATGLT